MNDKTYVALWWNYDEDGKDKKKKDDAAGFLNQANREVTGRRSEYYSAAAYGYRTGDDVFKALITAYLLSNGEDLSGSYIRRPIQLVNIFGHGVAAGLTSGYHKGIRGLYSFSKLIDSDGVEKDVDSGNGGRIITNLPTDIFATDAVIVLHNCSTSRHFAVAFLQHLVDKGKDGAKVIAHRDLTGTPFNIQWYEHTKDNPSGMRRGPLGREYWLHPG